MIDEEKKELKIEVDIESVKSFCPVLSDEEAMEVLYKLEWNISDDNQGYLTWVIPEIIEKAFPEKADN